MFDALQTISRVETNAVGEKGGDEDKGQLNHLVILIENMWYFIVEIQKAIRQRNTNSALGSLIKRAESIYGDSLMSYTQFVLRRPLAKMMDFGDGIDALLRSTPATEVSLHSAYSKSSYKKLVKDYTAKDTRKAVEALSKRVAKHFGDEDDGLTPSGTTGATTASSATADTAAGEEVLNRVWTSCEEGYLREFDRLNRIGRNCYPELTSGGGTKLELGPNEVRRLFSGLAPKRR